MSHAKIPQILRSTMPPKTKQRRNDSATAHQEQNLLHQLPEAVLTLITKQLTSSGLGDAMLAVSRAARDAILRSLSQISLLCLKDQGSAARLLNRACCEASPGLDVELHLKDQENDALLTLLQAAFDSAAGWHKVHKLRVRRPVLSFAQFHAGRCCRQPVFLTCLQVVSSKTTHLNLLGPAMPCLKHLKVDLHGNDEGEGGLFTGLQACTGLEVLHVSGLSISPAAVKPCALLLARLPALKDVSLHIPVTGNTGPSGFVQQLTGLTSLCFDSYGCDHVSSMFAAAAHNPALQAFSVGYAGDEGFSAAELQHFLTSCTSLTSLDVTCFCFDEDDVEVLLTYGTKITTLKAFMIGTDTSFAGRQCSWKSLTLAGDDSYPTVLNWANLPLKGVEELDHVLGSLGVLQLPLSRVEPDQLATVLRQATTNLAGCPAWQADPGSFIALHDDPSGLSPEPITFSAQQRIQLLEALAPVGGPHVKRFEATVQDAVFEWGRPELQALGRSLSSGQLSSLELSYCILTTGFWAALDEVLPALSSLQLLNDVICSVADVIVYCSKRRNGHPFTLTLGDAVYTAVGGPQLQAALAAQGSVHVSVERHTP
jgi:hypothetical protein